MNNLDETIILWKAYWPGPDDTPVYIVCPNPKLKNNKTHNINISVQYNGGLLPGIILLTQGYYQWGTRLNTM